MSDIAEYERRISFALERIGRGVEVLGARNGAPAPRPKAEAPPAAGAAAQDDAELAALRDALEAERTANAQLSERVRAIREKQETTLSALEKKLAQATRNLDAAQSEITRLRRANAELVATNSLLSDAEGAVEPHLINRAMQAELEALRAARAAEAQEMGTILGALDPILEAAEKATETGHG